MGELSADGVFTSTITRRGRFLRSLARVQTGRICLSTALVSATRAAVHIAVRYSWQRTAPAPGAGDRPLMLFRTQQLALLGALARVYVMTFFLNDVKRRHAESFPTIDADLIRRISIAKAISSWEMTDVITACRERVGAQGMFSVNRIADYVAMAQGVVTAEGDNLPIFIVAANEMLLHRFGDIADATPPSCDSAPLDGRFVTKLFKHKAGLLQQEIRQKMKAGDKAGGFGSSWDSNVNRACDMATAYGRYLALSEFWRVVDGVAAGPLRSVLELLGSLYATLHLQADSGWYLAHDLLNPAQVRGIPDVIDALCERLVPHSSTLTEAFQLSPDLLRAPICHDDYVAAIDSYLQSNVSRA
jgi:acyl-CoA oxidase